MDSSIAHRPDHYRWRQVVGTGALAGIGFTMSWFIAGQALTGADFAAAKVAVFLASIVAGALGIAVLWKPARTGGSVCRRTVEDIS